MDRRIRVKCPECAASIELLVDLQELLDVTCPRCQHLFTAKVPPPILEIVPVEVEPIATVEVIEEQTPAVRPTRLVHPIRAPRHKSGRPQPRPAPPPELRASEEIWLAPTSPLRPPEPVPLGTHIKAFSIATGSVIALGLLIMFGIMINSAVSNMEWPSSDEPEPGTELALSSPSDIPNIDENAPATELPIDASPSSESEVAAAPVTGTAANPSVDEPAGPTNTKPEAGKSEQLTIAERVVMLANQIADATKDSDHEFILDRTHPKLIELAGGRGKMLEILNKALEPMKTQGITIANYTVSSNVIVRQIGQKVFAILPTTMDLKYPNRTMRSESFLLAVSEDAGKTYTFIDGAGAAKNRQMLKLILPDLPDDLALPVAGIPREVQP